MDVQTGGHADLITSTSLPPTAPSALQHVNSTPEASVSRPTGVQVTGHNDPGSLLPPPAPPAPSASRSIGVAAPEASNPQPTAVQPSTGHADLGTMDAEATTTTLLPPPPSSSSPSLALPPPAPLHFQQQVATPMSAPRSNDLDNLPDQDEEESEEVADEMEVTEYLLVAMPGVESPSAAPTPQQPAAPTRAQAVAPPGDMEVDDGSQTGVTQGDSAVTNDRIVDPAPVQQSVEDDTMEAEQTGGQTSAPSQNSSSSRRSSSPHRRFSPSISSSAAQKRATAPSPSPPRSQRSRSRSPTRSRSPPRRSRSRSPTSSRSPQAPDFRSRSPTPPRSPRQSNEPLGNSLPERGSPKSATRQTPSPLPSFDSRSVNWGGESPEQQLIKESDSRSVNWGGSPPPEPESTKEAGSQGSGGGAKKEDAGESSSKSMSKEKTPDKRDDKPTPKLRLRGPKNPPKSPAKEVSFGDQAVKDTLRAGGVQKAIAEALAQSQITAKEAQTQLTADELADMFRGARIQEDIVKRAEEGKKVKGKGKGKQEEEEEEEDDGDI